MNQLPLDPAFAIEQYETLRREAIGTPSNSLQGQGLVLLLNRGMAEWFKALRVLSAASFVGTRLDESLVENTTPRLNPSLRSPLTTLLANMVVTCDQEVRQ